jgi:hypothetical protein
MMPANTVASLRNYLANGDVFTGPISKESSGFEPWLDPFGDKRCSLFKTQGVNILTKVSSRLKSLLKAHVFHPALLTFDTQKENEEVWFKDMEPSGITVECLLLRCKNESEKNDVEALGPISPNIKYVHERGLFQADEESTNLSRNDIINDVIRTYTSLCAFDPYLNVTCSFNNRSFLTEIPILKPMKRLCS